MKNIKQLFILWLLFYSGYSLAIQNETEATPKPKTALLIIDIQEFCFPGGSSALVNPVEASQNAKKVLDHFRKSGQLVVHVKHKSSKGAGIHELVRPIEGEKVFEKTQVNCFLDPQLHQYLQDHEIERLVICGMQTHMCVEAATRAACDLGYACTLIQDACATKDLEFQGAKISAADVHQSTLATLNVYLQIAGTGKITDTKEFLSEN